MSTLAISSNTSSAPFCRYFGANFALVRGSSPSSERRAGNPISSSVSLDRYPSARLSPSSTLTPAILSARTSWMSPFFGAATAASTALVAPPTRSMSVVGMRTSASAYSSASCLATSGLVSVAMSGAKSSTNNIGRARLSTPVVVVQATGNCTFEPARVFGQKWVPTCCPEIKVVSRTGLARSVNTVRAISTSPNGKARRSLPSPGARRTGSTMVSTPIQRSTAAPPAAGS